MTFQITYNAINSHQFQIIYYRYIKVCNECSWSLYLKKEERKKKNLLTTTMQYTLAKENHITVVVGCRKGQRHQCRPPMTYIIPSIQYTTTTNHHNDLLFW